MKYQALALFLAVCGGARAEPLQLLTEEYPPFSYREGDTLSGISVAPSLDLSLKKLQCGRVDLMIMTRTTYESLRQQAQPVEAALNLEGTRAGIACNLQFPTARSKKCRSNWTG
jgi:hypothetical protein